MQVFGFPGKPIASKPQFFANARSDCRGQVDCSRVQGSLLAFSVSSASGGTRRQSSMPSIQLFAALILFNLNEPETEW